jgi:hypothetical protein
MVFTWKGKTKTPNHKNKRKKIKLSLDKVNATSYGVYKRESKASQRQLTSPSLNKSCKQTWLP